MNEAKMSDSKNQKEFKIALTEVNENGELLYQIYNLEKEEFSRITNCKPDAIPLLEKCSEVFEILNKQTKDLFEKNRNAKSIAIDNEIEIAQSKNLIDKLKQKIASLDNKKSQLIETKIVWILKTKLLNSMVCHPIT